MPRTALHIGAHKTATTFMQKTFAQNQALLAQRGVHYLPLDLVRKNFTAMLNNNNEANDITRALIEAGRKQDLLISDENISGSPADLIKSGAYYPNIGQRVASAISILGNPRPEIFLACREYASFTISMYCEYLRHRDFMLFDNYFQIFRKSGFNWETPVAQILKSAPEATLTVWDFSQFRERQLDIMTAISGIDAGLMEAPADPVRTSFSGTTISALEHLFKIMPAHQVKRAVQPLSRAFPRGAEFAAYDPLRPAVHAELAERYREDLEKIRKKYPQVRFL